MDSEESLLEDDVEVEGGVMRRRSVKPVRGREKRRRNNGGGGNKKGNKGGGNKKGGGKGQKKGGGKKKGMNKKVYIIPNDHGAKVRTFGESQLFDLASDPEERWANHYFPHPFPPYIFLSPSLFLSPSG